MSPSTPQIPVLPKLPGSRTAHLQPVLDWLLAQGCQPAGLPAFTFNRDGHGSCRFAGTLPLAQLAARFALPASVVPYADGLDDRRNFLEIVADAPFRLPPDAPQPGRPFAHPLPPGGSAAHQALLEQGTDPYYPGYDAWQQPEAALPAGTRLVQFDHRPAADIGADQEPLAAYFCDVQTAASFMQTGGQMSAADLAEALQARPYRYGGSGPFRYAPNVVVYELLRPLAPADYGVATALGNPQWGPGGATRYVLRASPDGLFAQHGLGLLGTL